MKFLALPLFKNQHIFKYIERGEKKHGR